MIVSTDVTVNKQDISLSIFLNCIINVFHVTHVYSPYKRSVASIN